MQEPMFCVCGYSAHSGNKLAKHLGEDFLINVNNSYGKTLMQEVMVASLLIPILRKLRKQKLSLLVEKHHQIKRRSLLPLIRNLRKALILVFLSLKPTSQVRRLPRRKVQLQQLGEMLRKKLLGL